MPSPSIAERLNPLPIVRTHRAATLIVGIGVFFDLFDIFLAGVLGTVLTSEFLLTPTALQIVLASGFLGMFVGASGLGAFADRFGRRTAFMVNLALYSAAIVPLGLVYTMAANVFSNAFHIFQAEIFPTAVRATAAGTAYGLSRRSSAAMPFVLLPILHESGPAAAFGAVSVAMLIVMLDVTLFAPSTTGRKLEDVAAEPVRDPV